MPFDEEQKFQSTCKKSPDWHLSLIDKACLKLMRRPSTNEIILTLV